MATDLPSSNTGSASCQPSGSSPFDTRSNSSARSGCAVRHVAIRLSQAACASAPRSRAARAWRRTSSATSKVCSGSKPRTRLVAAISSSPRAEPWEASVFCAVGAGQAMIVRMAMMEGRPVSALAAVERGVQRGDVDVAVGGGLDALDVPAVRLVPLQHVLGEGGRRVALDGDVVVVVEKDEVAELLVAGERGRLGGDALLQVAVGDDRPDGVVEGGLALGRLGVEQAALVAGGHRHAHRVGDALAERSGGRLHTRRVPVLGVAGRLGAVRAERLEVVQLQLVPGEEELGVEGQRRVAGGEHEAVTAGPLRVGRVVPHHLLKDRVRGRRQAHRGARVAVPDLLHRVGRQNAGGVDGTPVEFGPLEAPSGVCVLIFKKSSIRSRDAA